MNIADLNTEAMKYFWKYCLYLKTQIWTKLNRHYLYFVKFNKCVPLIRYNITIVRWEHITIGINEAVISNDASNILLFLDTPIFGTQNFLILKIYCWFWRTILFELFSATTCWADSALPRGIKLSPCYYAGRSVNSLLLIGCYWREI